MARRMVLLLVAFVVLGSLSPARADVVQCGDVLGPGGRFILEQDVTCDPTALRVAITVQDGAILDLNGHTVNCPHEGIECVILTGKGAKLLNGLVRGAFHFNIALAGAGWHTVKNVTSPGPVDGNVNVTSDHNTLIDVMAESFQSEAFVITGRRNRLMNSIALCRATLSVCISVVGDSNHLIDNFVSGDVRAISVSGDNNVLQGNRAIGTGVPEPAIGVTGTGNRITNNTAITENGIDLADTNGDCDHNTWRNNIFVTSDPACIR
jgi:hypothetical protein